MAGTQFFVFSQYQRRPVGLHKKYLLSFANYDIAIVAFFSIGMSYPNAEHRNMTIDGKGEKLKLKVAV